MTPPKTPGEDMQMDGPCRAQFESWYASSPECPSIQRDGEGYKLMQAHLCWTAWKEAWVSCERNIMDTIDMLVKAGLMGRIP